MMFNSQAARHPAQTLALNSQYIPPPYDLYHHDPSPGAWNPVYASREEYPYGFPASSPSTGQVCFSPPDHNAVGGGGGNSFSPYSFISGQDAFASQRRPRSESLRASLSVGKTRTTDKYRVVYTDQQRQELEREFQCNRYITMRRKSELSVGLGLSERQVKIWFQNRRAKERKLTRKKQQHSQQASTTTPTPPVLAGPADANIATSPCSSNILSDTISEEY